MRYVSCDFCKNPVTKIPEGLAYPTGWNNVRFVLNSGYPLAYDCCEDCSKKYKFGHTKTPRETPDVFEALQQLIYEIAEDVVEQKTGAT